MKFLEISSLEREELACCEIYSNSNSKFRSTNVSLLLKVRHEPSVIISSAVVASWQRHSLALLSGLASFDGRIAVSNEKQILL